MLTHIFCLGLGWGVEVYDETGGDLNTGKLVFVVVWGGMVVVWCVVWYFKVVWSIIGPCFVMQYFMSF